MAFELPALPYDKSALEPHISAETLEYHYGRHHQSYVNQLNALIHGTADAGKSLEEIITSSSGVLFNQAAQVWSHTFYWHCLAPNGGGEPGGCLAEAINARFGSFDTFKETFNAHAMANVGSGWTWLIKTADGGVDILDTRNADTPIAHGQTPLMAIDLWEHAYYIDYRNARLKYLESLWNVLNWDFIAQNFAD